MSWKSFLVLAFFSLFLSPAMARSSRAEHKLAGIKAALMAADYRGDLAALAALRLRARQFSSDPKLGYLADYWSGFASWRIVVNGSWANMPAGEAEAHLTDAVADFESSVRKNSRFADSYAGGAAVHGWLGAYKRSDQAAMNDEIAAYKRLLGRALELEPSNPRVLWIEAVPFVVLPPERGGNVDRAIDLYRKMLDVVGPADPESPLPDWGRAEALMSMASAYLKKSDVSTAAEDARAALQLEPEWHYVRDVLIPQIDGQRK